MNEIFNEPRFNRSLWKNLNQPSPSGNRELITVKQYAKENNRSTQGVIYMIKRKKLKAIKRGGKWWIYPDSTFKE